MFLRFCLLPCVPVEVSKGCGGRDGFRGGGGTRDGKFKRMGTVGLL